MDKDKPGNGGGGGGLKQRLAQMLLRSACTTATTTNASTSFVSVSKNNNGKSTEEPTTPSLSSLLNQHKNQSPQARPKLDRPLSVRSNGESRRIRNAPVVQISIECGGRRSLHGTNTKLVPLPPKEEKKMNNGSTTNSKKSAPVSPCSPSTKFYYSSHENRRKKTGFKPKIKENKKIHSNPYGFNTSSSEHSDNELGLFSSERELEEETQTLFSSKSFSSDSSEFYQTNKPKPRHNSKPRKALPSPKPSTLKKETESFKPLISVSSKEEEVRESSNGLAVVKRSCNPYMDFRSSMVEMLVEQKISNLRDMERLLQSYLELNSAHHHPVILRAFEDICEAIFYEE